NGEPKAGPNLTALIDFGTFAIIAKPLFYALRWTYDHIVANWGWAIVLLTIVINAALFPLRYIGMKSALKQQKIQPEVNQIMQRYKGLKFNDPRMLERQKEIQAVQTREGINQTAGCLPMLLQIPFLFAFYSMLSTAFVFRHAHWLWIKDLSGSDPIYILP